MGNLVLIVDDSITVCKIIEVALHRAEYEVKCCASAELAIEWLRSTSARIPDLILVDLLLPKMDGSSLIRFLRSYELFCRVPFVIITRKSGLLDRLRGKLVGASDYLVKPLEIGPLLAVVQKYLGIPVPIHSFS